MPKVEIEESELAALQQVTKFFQTGLANPKTRQDVLRLQKTLNPEAVIPELEAADHVSATVKTVEEKVDAVLKRLDERLAKDEETSREKTLREQVDTGRAQLRAAGYNAEGVEKVEKFMLENGVANYAAGMAYFEKLNPPSAPADASTSRWGSLPDPVNVQDDHKALWDSRGIGAAAEAWTDAQISKIRSEFRN